MELLRELSANGTQWRPKDWRVAYDSWMRFKAVWRHYGNSAAHWKLEYPTQVGRHLDFRWQMTYQGLDKVHHTVFAGTDAHSVSKNIEQLLVYYARVLEVNRQYELQKRRDAERRHGYDISDVLKEAKRHTGR